MVQQTALKAFPEQLSAADVTRSVWVDASAGTGKTKVLTDRVLRLLLPRHNGEAATPPERLLCVTFTNAGAAEMIERVQRTARKWLEQNDTELTNTLHALFGVPPNDAQMQAAKRLFAQIIDAPGGLKIMTLHAFGQSILRRFPMEAGIATGFTLATASDIEQLRNQARNEVFTEILNDTGSDLHQIMMRLSKQENESRLLDLLMHTQSEREWAQHFFVQNTTRNMQEQAFCAALGIPPLQAQDFLDAFWHDLGKHRDFLVQLRDKSSTHCTGKPRGHADMLCAALNDYLSQHNDEILANKDAYKKIFLKSDGTTNLNSIKLITKIDEVHLLPVYQKLADELLLHLDSENQQMMVTNTLDLFTLGEAIAKRFAALKTRKNMLDFDDQILATKRLLQSRAAWVMYKLDQGIDHILLDEAQDTNPDQWAIIDALVEEFFAGIGARENVTRTLFTVGDEKQSIFGFQRADPDLFGIKQRNYAAKVAARTDDGWRKIGLTRSFRTSAPVLCLVDTVMNLPTVRTDLISTNEAIGHIPHRAGAAGQVVLHPPMTSDDLQSDDSDWPILRERPRASSATAKLVEKTVADIKGMIGQKMLPSQNRLIRAGDILILLRKRSTLQKTLVRALRQNNIEVSGLDKMLLSDNIAIQDLLQLALCSLQPFDDLRLAGILKSPFVRMREEDLFTLCYGREKQSLYAMLQQNAALTNITDWLQKLSDLAHNSNPYHFFSHVLTHPCPTANSGMRALLQALGRDSREVIESLINLALDRQHTHPDLLSFCRDIMENPPEIKRQIAPGQDDAVTIMTVHGSKGLQAPIVIMPDTVSRRDMVRATDNLLWPRASGLPVPVWAKTDNICQIYADAKLRAKARDDAEYRRLLYVGITRPEDELHIYGAVDGKKQEKFADKQNWYNWCKQAFDTLLQQNQALPHQLDITSEAGEYRLWRDQTDMAKSKDAPEGLRATPDHFKPAAWAYESAADSHLSQILLRPSQLGSFEPSALSPLISSQSFRFERGLLTHTLLQYLPDVPPDIRNAVMTSFLDKQGHDLPDAIRASIIDEVQAILAHPDYLRLFGSNARAEVPISGQLADGALVSGQIDRLVVEDDRIILLDYKTNRPPPANVENVPQSYRRQLATYRALLSQIYPNKPITCYLLWTDGARLMAID